MAFTRLAQWLCVLVCMSILRKTECVETPLTLVQDAVAKGAVCLDGSPPGYHFDKGSGDGINNWLVHIEGGGWCATKEACVKRMKEGRGSTTHMKKTMSFSGVLSGQQKFNPDFYSWNRIKVRYCDGSSLTGDVEAVDPATNLHYRGARIFRAVIDDLMEKGMKNAKNAILSGCSAGGLAAILNCDKFRDILPPSAKVKCLSDAGFFVNGKDISGGSSVESLYRSVVALHGSVKNLPPSCTSKMNPNLCFFPQNVIPTLRTPIFLVNAAYDSWQLKNVFVPKSADRQGSWESCKVDIKKCSSNQVTAMQGFRQEFLGALNSLGNSSTRGMFIDSCHAHCQIGTQDTWMRTDSPMLSGTTIGKAVGDWYYERRSFQNIDCPYPCNPTCKNGDSDSE